MTDAHPSFAISPNRGLGWITLGASLHAILTRLKSRPQVYPHIDLAYSAAEPVLDPIVLNLPSNGIRLRFDGPDQRLRLIEIIDFSRSDFTIKSVDVVRRATTSSDSVSESVPGPSFRHLYTRLIGPSYAGEYLLPTNGEAYGTYVLSWAGFAARFAIRHKAWSEKADFVTLLSSSAASPATSLAIFSGSSWPEIRDTLYTKRPQLPRSLALTGKSSESIPDEIDEIVVHTGGRLDLIRRSSTPFTLILHETTPQDLVAELGPPDAIFRKSGSGLAIHTGGSSSKPRHPSMSPGLGPQFNDQDSSSARSLADDSENDTANPDAAHDEDAVSEAFYNYFHHGFDVLVSTPKARKVGTFPKAGAQIPADFVVTKIFLHSNVPGSYSFNRHSRCRWRIKLDDNGHALHLTSEMRFQEVSDTLKDVLHGSYKDAEEEKRMQRAMVLNRGWGVGDSPESSIELLGDFEQGPSLDEQDSLRVGTDAAVPNMNTTELFGFPGLLFEVLKNDSISCLTVYEGDP